MSTFLAWVDGMGLQYVRVTGKTINAAYEHAQSIWETWPDRVVYRIDVYADGDIRTTTMWRDRSG